MIGNREIRNISIAGVFSALSIVLVLFIHFPIFPAVPFLEYDPADITIFLMTAALGPWYGLGMTAAVSIIQGLTVSAGSGWVGIVMHIAATGSFVIAESVVLYIFRKRSIHKNGIIKAEKIYSFPQMIAATAVGVISMTAMMALWNLILTPYFMGLPLEAILPLYPFMVLFNLVKASVNGIVAILLYKSLSKVFVRYLY